MGVLKKIKQRMGLGTYLFSFNPTRVRQTFKKGFFELNVFGNLINWFVFNFFLLFNNSHKQNRYMSRTE